MAKQAQPKKPKQKQGDGVEAAAVISVRQHPRSAAAVRRAKGWGGLLGLALTTYLAIGAQIPPLEAMLRGLAGGVFGYILFWAIAVTIARQLVVAEVRAHYAELAAAAAAAPASDGA